MRITSKGVGVRKLVQLGRINTLRLLHERGVKIFVGLESPLKITDPDVLEFILSVNNEVVDVRWIVDFAVQNDLLDLLEILHHWQKKFPLTRANLTRAAEEGSLSILQWAHSIDPTVQPEKSCMVKIMTKEEQYLPTTEELRNQPVEFIQHIHFHQPNHLSHQDFMELCKSKRIGADIHKWLLTKLGINVANLEMANAAARIGNIEALDWIVKQNPEVFPSRAYIKDGLCFMWGCRATELLEWLFNQRPGAIPDWKHLQEWNYPVVAPEMFLRVKNYQERNGSEEEQLQVDQENMDETTQSLSDQPSSCDLF
ncbi:hypothetical protein PSACC_01096 [Paramicrosporidium saccamoebae]|uniref:Uncharacterized protein n=1 Tax=Paramicrosporidium saccamoebae TaxID=1246581 RepID=A0A2H9TMX1_9FUNG|nr:hypothetical protein PSACC_01096 [Paramicrosporidium saccamoebae]